MCTSLFCSKMFTSSFYSKMRFKIKMGQTYFGLSQNEQMANSKRP